MVAAIRQQVTVQPGGVIEIRSPELEPGSRAEVIVLLTSRAGASGDVAGSTTPPAATNGARWRRHAGAVHGGAADASDNAGIDADLAREHVDPHGPKS